MEQSQKRTSVGEELLRISIYDIKRSPSIFAGSSECFSPYILLSPHWSVHASMAMLFKGIVHTIDYKVDWGN